MDEAQALQSLSALAHAHRLAMVRALVAAGPEGLTACSLAQTCAISPSAASFHLAALETAGLIAGSRLGRHIYYRASTQSIGALLDYLMNDCCGADPTICACALPGTV